MAERPAPAPRLVRLVIGSLTFLLFVLNTLFWCVLLFAVTLAKLVVPVAGWRRLSGKALVAIGEAWIAVNSRGLALTQPTLWKVTLPPTLRRDASYLVVPNHQSWVDIPVLQKVFRGRIPFLRFFLKQELIWVPVLGAAWWALDFPFMKRHSKEALEKNPEKRGEDLETTRRACERFRDVPASILNFAEGTRFTEAKRARSGSAFRHLLPPKTGGIAFTAAAMGPVLRSLLDVTIVYPAGRPGFWDLISRGLPEIVVTVREVPIPSDWFTGDYQGDEAFRERVQADVRRLWQAKDAEIGRILAPAAAG
ncbi:MAG TPA: acyltransferase [Thermoanaerobaculia bacterium]|nr:acyltransferase [Thermoanaerobaculia bacterium]HQR66772.1 acyltransferase [Thermoanaerobaculia bacterium]